MVLEPLTSSSPSSSMTIQRPSGMRNSALADFPSCARPAQQELSAASLGPLSASGRISDGGFSLHGPAISPMTTGAVARRGFEPLTSSLKGKRPGPLGDRAGLSNKDTVGVSARS